jgi:hypothetical protein
MKVNVVGFVNRKHDILKPILAKVAIMVVMTTLATVLYFTAEPWIGIVIYAKEVAEFVFFVWYLKKRRRTM